MSANLKTIEQEIDRRQNFVQGKKLGEILARSVNDDELRDVAVFIGQIFKESSLPGAAIPYATAQGMWYGLDYQEETLSMITSKTAGAQ